jgi:hypothetical protein
MILQCGMRAKNWMQHPKKQQREKAKTTEQRQTIPIVPHENPSHVDEDEDEANSGDTSLTFLFSSLTAIAGVESLSENNK